MTSIRCAWCRARAVVTVTWYGAVTLRLAVCVRHERVARYRHRCYARHEPWLPEYLDT